MQRYKFVLSSEASAMEDLPENYRIMIRPPGLQPGDKIGIVAPARKVSKEEMAPAIRVMELWGYGVVEGRYLYGSNKQFSGTDEERTADFQSMLNDPEVKAILCARGGYGSVRIVDRLDFSEFKSHPKWIVGYSDITVFHSHIHTHYGIQTLHAAMPVNFPATGQMNESLESLKTILEGGHPVYTIPLHEFNSRGKADGKIVGGNLSILYSLMGSVSDIETRGKILFIEDLDEYLYHIDRMMMNLKRSGKLEGLAGLIVGGMNDMNDNEVPYGQTAYEIIAGAVSEYNFPKIFGFQGGHISENLGLIIGGRYEMEVGDECILKLS